MTNADDTPATIRRMKLSNWYFNLIIFVPLKFFMPYFPAILVYFGITFWIRAFNSATSEKKGRKGRHIASLVYIP